MASRALTTLSPPMEAVAAFLGARSHCVKIAVDLLSPTAVGDSRRAVADWLRGWPVSDDDRYNASVVVSELITNEIKASGCLPPVRLVPDPSPVVTACTYVRHPIDDPRWRITITVSGFGAGTPELATLSDEEDDDECGRGLFVVAALCDHLETLRSAHTVDGLVLPYGKRVVAHLAPA